MESASGQTTNPKLLKQVVNWDDDFAWNEFFRAYDPWVRRWIGVYRLNDDQAEELSQRIWVELASRVRAFRYDPSRKFRGWLRRLIQFRALDLMRELKQDRPRPLGDESSGGMGAEAYWSRSFGDDEESSQRPLLRKLAEQAQEAVRARVAPESWQAFQLISLESWSIGDAAGHMGKTYASVFRNHQRVGRMLSDEGRRLLSRPIEMRPKLGGRGESTSDSR